MAIPTSMAGSTVDAVEHDIDARWTMAYAASLNDHLDAYMNTSEADGVVAHPMFPVCVEWPAIVDSRQLSIASGVPEGEIRRGVHAWHDLVVHRLIRPEDRLTTSLSVAGVAALKPGAHTTTRLITTDADGELVATTTQGSISIGVPTDGADRPDSSALQPLEADRVGEPDVVSIDIAAGLAHTYTECARIWNPIHTDKAVALSMGLPDLILHGTATMALGVSAIVRHRADGDPHRVRRIVGRFGAMVLMPSTITVRVWPTTSNHDGSTVVPYEIVNQDGDLAVSRGVVQLGSHQ